MSRYLANEDRIVWDAREAIEQIEAFYLPPDSMDEDDIVIAAFRAIEAIDVLYDALAIKNNRA